MVDWKERHPARLFVGVAFLGGWFGALWAIKLGMRPLAALAIPFAAWLVASFIAWYWTRILED